VFKRLAILGVVTPLLVTAARPARAAQLPPATATAPALAAEGVQSMRGTITGIVGMVQVRNAGDAPWRKAEVGMAVDEQTEFRTGVRSAVRFELPGGHTISLDRLGVVKLLTAVRDSKKITTEVGMPYGRTRYDIEEAGVDHESRITSPSSTLAIRGTKVSLYDQRPFRAEAVSLTGRADFKDVRKQVAFGNKGQGKTKVNTAEPNAVAAALTLSYIDPGASLARTDAEAKIVDTLLSRGSTVTFDREAGIKVVRGGFPPTDAQLVPALPGVLNFVVRWDTNSDLNLSVGSPGGGGAGEFLHPLGALDVTASGGKTAFDHRGGEHGGIEIAYFPADYPKGLYGLGLVLVSGQPTVARVDAFLNGKRIGIFDGLTLQPTVAVPVLPPTQGISEGTLAGIVPVGVKIPQAGGGPRGTTSVGDTGGVDRAAIGVTRRDGASGRR
jgi:hypothetical protein